MQNHSIFKANKLSKHWLTVYYPIHNLLPFNNNKLRHEFLHMNQMPWTCYPHCWSQRNTHYKQTSSRKWKLLFLFCSRSNREYILYTDERRAGVTCSESMRDGGRRVRPHTCVNNTKQKRFISGRKNKPASTRYPICEHQLFSHITKNLCMLLSSHFFIKKKCWFWWYNL